ncbi:amino acid ABC transporter permease [Neisseria shayeganii]|uniref:Putative glutamine transport system permease protein GlnP n=2 Tax=Neisseria shayeganii TaxID=607712 RepID=G4CI50_9NEIS|nr:amino acid ABC transporter permease [Neisseria shayeganii]EGY52451.1 amino acid ABC superfamily ATP binding cassette transporter, permease protein [Neisseria shayeganii 871]QMT40191.1 amino acid ABC transporter permease [Neisseria shayeganii]
MIAEFFQQNFPIIYEYREMFFKGALTALGLTVVAVVFGTILGLINALIRVIKVEQGNFFTRAVVWVLKQLSWLYLTLFRGTPLFIQIFIWYHIWSPFVVHPQHGLLISGDTAAYLRQNYAALIAGGLALSVNAGAYITEIFRAGIQSIDRGQMEAARSLGMSYVQAMRYIILPQAVRRMLPPFGNEFITLLKDSSLVSAIAVAELAYVAKSASGRYSVYEEPYYFIALVYLVMIMGLTALLSWLEKKYSVSHER